MPASKLFMMQQSHLKDSLLSANDVGAKTTMAHTNGQSNGTAKIVLVSNETMEIDSRNHCANVTTSTANDEELTSLTWLQNKNLLKGTGKPIGYLMRLYSKYREYNVSNILPLDGIGKSDFQRFFLLLLLCFKFIPLTPSQVCIYHVHPILST